jgi:hypothetical protein
MTAFAASRLWANLQPLGAAGDKVNPLPQLHRSPTVCKQCSHRGGGDWIASLEASLRAPEGTA